MDSEQPIIIKRKKKFVNAHHGGSWKVAFADFATALMAFFLVLWLLQNATPEQRLSVSGYFKNPVGFADGGHDKPIDLGGRSNPANVDALKTGGKMDLAEMDVNEDSIREMNDEIDYRESMTLKEMLEQAIESSQILNSSKDHIRISIVEEGVLIQIVDKSGEPMFAVGSDRLRRFSEDLIIELGRTLSVVRNMISVTGHTDSLKFSGNPDYSNWELSSDRAHAARRALVMGGVGNHRISKVVGLSNTVPFIEAEDDAMNRRIALVVLHEKAETQKDASTTPVIDLTGRSEEAQNKSNNDWQSRAQKNQPLPGEEINW